MAQQRMSEELVILQELAVSNAYEIAALVGVLERQGSLMEHDTPPRKERP